MSGSSDLEDQQEFLQPIKARIVPSSDEKSSELRTQDRAEGKNTELDELVPCVFVWGHGGHEVYLTGSFNNWSHRVKMIKNGHEFVIVLELKRERHLYKFVVDEMWKFSPDQEIATDEHGHVNNVLDITRHQRFCPWLSSSEKSEKEQANVNTFSQKIPDASEYTTDAPPLPFLLGKAGCPAAHPPPQITASLHGLVNHIYHDSNVGSALGPKASVLNIIYRQARNYNHKYLIALHISLSPMPRHAMVPFCQPWHEFVQKHFGG